MGTLLTITRSSHPEFDLFATVTIKGQQIARQGTRTEIDQFLEDLAVASAPYDVRIIVADDDHTCAICEEIIQTDLYGAYIGEAGEFYDCDADDSIFAHGECGISAGLDLA